MFFFWEGGYVRSRGGSLSTRGEIANGSVTKISCAGVCASLLRPARICDDDVGWKCLRMGGGGVGRGEDQWRVMMMMYERDKS